jgi:DNA replication protein DnaC
MKPQPLKQKNHFDLEQIKQQAAILREQNPTNRPDPPKCAVCGDNEGYAVRLDNGREVYRVCDCAKANNVARHFESSKITFAFRSMNFTAFNLADVHALVRDAYRIAQDYTRDFDYIQGDRKNSIALLGRSGSGKTHLLMSVSNELLDRGKELFYFPYAEGLSELKKNNFALLDEGIRKMQTAEILFIDDLWKGREEPTSWQIEPLYGA